ncbi:uncharacterized protein LOC116108577 [Pistacia vera]|uniref:Uncharacterized protein n=1 Tax=Pistacia integerrima TaxID=434235 RepID=A0ACC0XZY8_9ROSI|nr:uncharacterized protein LOC116108577 [Pistacia vera]KAJ0026318.1 hypothetical protein Pint_07092 [Pistacia integerrima]
MSCRLFQFSFLWMDIMFIFYQIVSEADGHEPYISYSQKRAKDGKTELRGSEELTSKKEHEAEQAILNSTVGDPFCDIIENDFIKTERIEINQGEIWSSRERSNEVSALKTPALMGK